MEESKQERERWGTGLSKAEMGRQQHPSHTHLSASYINDGEGVAIWLPKKSNPERERRLYFSQDLLFIRSVG